MHAFPPLITPCVPARWPRPRRSGLLRGAWAALAFLALGMPSSVSAPPTGDDVSAEHLQELEDTVSESRSRLRRQKADAERLAQEMREIRTRSVEAAFEVQKREARLNRIEARLGGLLVEENAVVDRLRTRKQALVSVLAALQAMEQNKPPALLVNPDDAVNAARSAMLLGSVVPDIYEQAAALGRELDALTNVRARIEAERDDLQIASADLLAEQKQLAALLVEKEALEKATREAAKEEALRLAQLAEQARDLRGLIEDLTERAAGLQPLARPSGARRVAPAPAPGPSASPGLATAKGRLRAPVAGRIVRRFGTKDDAGHISEGLTFATRPGAQIVAPFDARVSFAQPYRNYGQVLILTAGDGYHFVLTGLAQIYAVVGQELLAGEPIGIMGATAPVPAAQDEDTMARTLAMTVAGASSAGGAGVSLVTQGPTLYFELRKDGEPVDPLPWLTGATRNVSG